MTPAIALSSGTFVFIVTFTFLLVYTMTIVMAYDFNWRRICAMLLSSAGLGISVFLFLVGVTSMFGVST